MASINLTPLGRITKQKSQDETWFRTNQFLTKLIVWCSKAWKIFRKSMFNLGVNKPHENQFFG